jgi:hypothetical protein
MSRILGRSNDTGSAFDFDVVTDVPPPPSRRPDPAPPERAPEAARAEPGLSLGAKRTAAEAL